MVILYKFTVLRRLQTIYVFSVNHTSRRRGDTKASAWSRALTTAWSRAYCAITIMASNTYNVADNGSRSRNRGIYITVALKTKFKRHLPGEFHDFSWVFWSRHCSRKGARRAEERRKKKTKMTKLDFHRFQVRHFSNSFERSPCYCKMGQRQRADLSVFERIKFITRRNISV